MEGIIIRQISNDYTVKSGNNTYICKPRGKFRKTKVTPLVGDNVVFDENECYLLDVLPRRNFLVRPSIANIDQAFIMTSVKTPNFSTNLLDKFITIINYNNIIPVICITKMDLLDIEEQEVINEYIKYYEKLGITVVLNDDKWKLKSLIKGKVTVFTGQTGSGKSTLLNMIDKSLNLKTGEISKALGRGKHTTRHTELFSVMGGFVVDTPGFSSLELVNMKPIDIRDNMPPMFDYLDRCKYQDCMHLNEDKCYVKEQIKKDDILNERYENYKKFLTKKEK